MQALLNPRVLALSAVYFGVVATNYGLTFFLPQIVQGFGMSNLQIGLVSVLPYVVERSAWSCGGDAQIVSSSVDSTWRSRCWWRPPAQLRWQALDDPAMKMMAFSVAGFGIFASLPIFWTLPTAFLSGTAAAGGIAMINSIGNLAGFAGPYTMGWIKDSTCTYAGGLLALAAAGFVAMIIVLALGLDRSPEQVPTCDRSGELVSGCRRSALRRSSLPTLAGLH